MKKEKYLELLDIAKNSAVEAGKEIMQVYEHQDEIAHKLKSDQSPLTEADRRSHDIIFDRLSDTEVPILSEEGRDIPFSERSQWEYFWLVDPLDGTKEFIKKNGEFTVNIALIHQAKPVMGVVYVPAQEKLYWGFEGEGAFYSDDDSEEKPLKGSTFSRSDSGLRVVGSRSHMNDETEEFISSLDNPEIVSMGSSLKFLILAEGNAELYPRFAPTMEWDTAAAHAILLEAGGKVINKETGRPLEYNKQNLLNPYFLATGNEI